MTADQKTVVATYFLYQDGEFLLIKKKKKKMENSYSHLIENTYLELDNCSTRSSTTPTNTHSRNNMEWQMRNILGVTSNRILKRFVYKF